MHGARQLPPVHRDASRLALRANDASRPELVALISAATRETVYRTHINIPNLAKHSDQTLISLHSRTSSMNRTLSVVSSTDSITSPTGSTCMRSATTRLAAISTLL